MTSRFLAVAALFAACSTSAVPARAESWQDLIAKNLASRGGAERLAAITSIEFSGKLIAPGDFELGYKETRARKSGAVRVETSVQGLTVIQAFDGHVGWRVNPFQGRRDAERMSADAARALADDGSIEGALLAARGNGSAVAYLGREDFEGTPAFKLRVTERDGTEYTYLLDPDTYLEIHVTETRTLRGAQRVTETNFGDYEQVSGVYFPFSIDSEPHGAGPDAWQTVTIESARANVPVPAALFAMPSAPAK